MIWSFMMHDFGPMQGTLYGEALDEFVATLRFDQDVQDSSWHCRPFIFGLIEEL